jgi:hypothetical protein
VPFMRIWHSFLDEWAEGTSKYGGNRRYSTIEQLFLSLMMYKEKFPTPKQ